MSFLRKKVSHRGRQRLICEVTAGSEQEAFDAAEDAICEALIASGVPIDPDWADCEQQRATPGEVDHNAL